MTTIRNRIREYRMVDPSEVAPNPRNWRLHPTRQRRALRAVLERIGIAGAVLAYYSDRNGGQLTLIDGHERMTVGVPFPALILDVTDEEADALLAAYDPLGDLAIAHDQKLADLIADLDQSRPDLSAIITPALDLPELITASPSPERASHRQRGAGYDFVIDPYKLAYRLEAVAHCQRRQAAIELYAGHGLLSAWYARLFDTLVRIDANPDCHPDVVARAEDWVQSAFDPATMQYDLVDFDAAGCPSLAMQRFFARIAGVWNHPFVLCVTDGNGLNFKSRGRVNLAESYLVDTSATMSKPGPRLYEQFAALVDHHAVTVAATAGYVARQISCYQGSAGNVVYACYALSPARDVAEPALG